MPQTGSLLAGNSRATAGSDATLQPVQLFPRGRHTCDSQAFQPQLSTAGCSYAHVPCHLTLKQSFRGRRRLHTQSAATAIAARQARVHRGQTHTGRRQPQPDNQTLPCVSEHMQAAHQGSMAQPLSHQASTLEPPATSHHSPTSLPRSEPAQQAISNPQAPAVADSDAAPPASPPPEPAMPALPIQISSAVISTEGTANASIGTVFFASESLLHQPI